MSQADPLTFTGERFLPACQREIWYEHWHRYLWASGIVAGRRVLDAACGEGYGSAWLARSASGVVALDIDQSIIDHARARYADVSNLTFQCGSVAAIEADDAAFDVVVSFETIEHLLAQREAIAEFRRVLAPDGVLLLSSPDRIAYNAHGGEPNPFHVRELDRSELLTLLGERFPSVRLYGQRLGFQSVIWPVETPSNAPAVWQCLDAGDGERPRSVPVPPPVYFLAVCSATAGDLPDFPGASVFVDSQEAILRHYNAEIARLIQADHRLIQLEKELNALREQLARRH